ncbi:hypothetical protein BJ912DRAFT_1151048 [Pholiota molesta]|nr:hypothetical protein BJ912DRAFT_1151048 [Pholiota molesta]
MAQNASTNASETDISSTRFCEICKIQVKLGRGGEGNWLQHVKGKVHLDNERKARPPSPHRGLMAFFKKATGGVRGEAVKPTAVKAPQPLFAASSRTVSHTPPTTSEITRTAAIFPQPDLSNQHPLLRHLRHVIDTLPSSVPEGVQSDALAAYSSLPVIDPDDDEGPFHSIDSALNRIIGFGATAASLKPLIRRGQFGMDGLFRYLRVCIEDIKIEPVLLEGKIERLVDAMVLCGARREYDASSKEIITKSDVPSLPDGDTGRESRPKTKAIIERPDTPTIDLTIDPLVSPCPGYKLRLPEGASPYSSYPIMLHLVLTLPWSVTIDSASIHLHSTACTSISRSTAKGKERNALPCIQCAQLKTNLSLQGIEDRIETGSHENSPYAYLTPAEMHVLLRRKTAQIKQLKLNALNKASVLSVRIRRLDAWKRMAEAIAREDIPRIRSLMAAQLRAGSSIFTILEKIDLAVQHKFIARGYSLSDHERGYLILKLGGRSAAVIAHRALGIPSIDAIKRRMAASPLRSSAGYPTKEELTANLTHCYPDSKSPSSFDRSAPIIGMSMQLDEIKIQERLRWDPRTNQILGVCREHGCTTPLEFKSMLQADALLKALQDGNVHLASEATVAGLSILTGEPADYSTRAFLISGSCKQEDYREHKRLILDSMDAVQSTQKGSNRRLYCICTDGEARRRRGLIDIALCDAVRPSDPIYPALAPLSLFNLRCGPDNITPDFDWKHVFKRFRNTLLRILGFTLNGIRITSSVLREHLIAAGMRASEADALLTPNDKQDVTLMLRLLVAISNLPPSKPTDRPTVQATRRVLCLLGRLYFYLLNAYLNVELSLHTQLVYLSAAAHIVLALYSRDKGDFIPVQTFFDVMSMIKNVYFCVAKMQRDDPNGLFYIILLGTDGLEKIFGKVRTMVGTDTNADVLQLTNRVDGATQCVIILENHPEWGGQARRLDLKPLDSNIDEISNKYDHLSPRSLKGDYRVNQVVLLGSWNEGCVLAEQALDAAEVPAPFTSMRAQGGFDMFSPFGDGKMVLVESELQEGERHETDEEQDHLLASTLIPPTPALSDDTESLAPDLDDVAGTAELENFEGANTNESTNTESPSPWVSLPDSSKPAHKASILRLYSNPLAITSDSRDRLKRVRGYSRYETSASQNTSHADDEDGALCIQDPIVTLVRSDDQIFLAIGQVLAIRRDGKELHSVLPQLLSEPNIRLQVHIMKIEEIRLQDSDQEVTQADWQWTGALESRGHLKDVPGRFFSLINPEYKPAILGQNTGDNTYVFSTSELRDISAILYERLHEDLLHLPAVPVTPSFPYRNLSGQACFVCEADAPSRSSAAQACCPFCPDVLISSFNGQNLLKHMGSHILHDPHVERSREPCGFCLNTSFSCKIFLKRNSMIDMTKSECPYLRNIRITQAKTFSVTQPCTNHPLRCPLCEAQGTGFPAVWKYNFRAHLARFHPTATPENHTEYWQLHENEKTLLRAVYDDRKRQRKSAPLVKSRLRVSDAHSSRLALRDVTSDHESDKDEDGDDDPHYEQDESELNPFGGNTEDTENLTEKSTTTTVSIVDEGSRTIDSTTSVPLIDDLPPSVQVVSSISSDSLFDDAQLPIAANSTASASGSIPDNLQAVPVPTGPMASDPSVDDTQAPIASGSASGLSEGLPTKRKRVASTRFQEIYGSEGGAICATCEGSVEGYALRCSSAGCNLKYHLHCRGLIHVPQSEWYCDDECKLTARGKAASRKKVRRGGKSNM